mmetsp:Transcript_17600/g.40708  ORF Transcript_17600/g.40708 Transcript_17600/m.40708 type:complete len:571 (+) Transcript_17600:52-1764(+)
MAAAAWQYLLDLRKALLRPAPELHQCCDDVSTVLCRPLTQAFDRLFTSLDKYYGKGGVRRVTYKCGLLLPAMVMSCIGVAYFAAMVSPTLCENVLAEAMFATYEERQEHRRCDNPRFRNGKLVVADCMVTDTAFELLHGWGPFQNNTVRTIGLRAEVEMYQCNEQRQGQLVVYRLDWSEAAHRSRSFSNPTLASSVCGEKYWVNPEWPDNVPRSGVQFAATMRVGSFLADIVGPDGSDAGKLRTPVTGWPSPPGWSTNLSELAALGSDDAYASYGGTGYGKDGYSYYYNEYSYYSETNTYYTYGASRRRSESSLRRRRYSDPPPVRFQPGYYYHTESQVDRTSKVGVVRARFFKNRMHIPSGKDKGDTAELRVIRVGRNDDGHITKWNAPWPCSHRYSQNRMVFQREKRGDYEEDMNFYWSFPNCRSQYEACVYDLPYSYRDGLVEFGVVKLCGILFLASSCWASCQLNALCASSESRPPMCGGCFCCCALCTGLAQFLGLYGVMNLLIIGPAVTGIGLASTGCIAACIATGLGLNYGLNPPEPDLQPRDAQHQLEAMPLGRSVSLSDLD